MNFEACLDHVEARTGKKANGPGLRLNNKRIVR